MLQYRIIDDLNLSTEEIEELIGTLPEWRREEALKFKHIQGRKENAMAYDLLRKMLGHEPRFEYRPHGKPYTDCGKNFNIFSQLLIDDTNTFLPPLSQYSF